MQASRRCESLQRARSGIVWPSATRSAAWASTGRAGAHGHLVFAGDDDGGLLEAEGVEAEVGAAQGDELVVVAVFDDASVLQDEDAVGVPDGGEAVGDDQGGAALGELADTLLDDELGGGVQVGGGLVQDTGIS